MRRGISAAVAAILLITTLYLPAGVTAKEETALSLQGADQLLLPSAGRKSRVQYTAALENGENTDEDIIYETDSERVLVDADGVVTLTESAEDFTLTARLAKDPSVSVSKSVTVAPGYYDDFESYAVGETPKNWVNGVTVKRDGENQSANLSAWNSRFLKSDGPLTDTLSGTYTMAYRCKVNGLGSSGVVLAIGPTASWGSYAEAKVKASGGGYSLVVVQDGADQTLTALPIGTWFDIACSFDLDRRVYDVFIDGALVGSGLSFQGDKVNGLDRMLLDRDKEVDDLQFFSGTVVTEGKAAETSITVSGPNSVLKPNSAATAAVTYTAAYSENGKPCPKEIVWSSSEGEMHENGNLYLDKNAAAGQITVTAAAADNPAVYQNYTVTVRDGFFDDFNDPTLPRSLGTLSFVETGGQAAVVANSLQTAFREGNSGLATLDFDIYLDASSGMILDLGQSMNWGTYLKLGLTNEGGTLKIRDNLDADLGSIAAGKWCKIKIELNFDAGSYTLYIDGEKHGEDLPLADSAAVRNIGKLWFSRSSVDNVAVYDGIENGALSIYGKSVLAIPQDGHTVTQIYTVKNRASSAAAEFSMESADGIWISPDGQLTVSSAAAERDYTVLADCGGKLYQKTVSLVRQNAVYHLTGDDVIRILPGEGEKRIDYRAADQNETFADASYALYPENRGVAVDAYGTVTVSPKSEDGTYLLIATIGGERLKKQIRVMRDRFTVNGREEVAASAFGTVMAEYRVENRDVVYQISPEGQGVCISTDGILRVLPDAVPGKFTVRALWLEDAAFYGTKTVTVSAKSDRGGIFADADGFVVYGAPDTSYSVALSYAADFRPKNFTSAGTATVKTDADGMAKIVPPAMGDGLYRADFEEDTAFFAFGADALLRGDISSDAFYAALSNCCGFSYAEMAALKEKATALSDPLRAAALCGGNPAHYPAAVLLWSYLESNRCADDATRNALSAAIAKIGLDPAPIALANAAYRTDLVLQSAAAADSESIAETLENIKTAAILKGIAYPANAKDTKKYLAVCGSTRYQTATEHQKNQIAEAVAGHEYATVAQLLGAIDALYLTDGSSGNSSGGSIGGGGSGIGGGGGVLAGKAEIVPTETPKPTETKAPRFADVGYRDWCYPYIEKMADKGVIAGEDRRFYPDRAVTRAEFIKMLCGIFEIAAERSGDVPFADVPADQWYAPYIGAAARLGLAEGADGKFDPNAPIRREDAAVLMLRFAKYAGMELTQSQGGYIDESEIAPYAKEAVLALSGAGVIGGFEDQSFRPGMTATRAEAAAVLARMSERQGGAA